MNTIILLGRVTGQPELKVTAKGISVCQFVMAVPRPGGSESTDFLPVVAWRHTAEFICRNIRKGERILLRGMLTSRSYTTRDGDERTSYEVVADQVEFADSKEHKAAAPTAAETIEEIIDDSDLPF